jgi:hypothetical protein
LSSAGHGSVSHIARAVQIAQAVFLDKPAFSARVCKSCPGVTTLPKRHEIAGFGEKTGLKE